MTLQAQCNNCASWVQPAPDPVRPTLSGPGFCGRNLAPPAGEVLCHQYTTSRAFQQQIISTMLKEQGPMAMPVKLMGGRKSARAANKKLGRR